MYICPKCKSVLKKQKGSFSCGSGHSYDISKDGYVNLLLSNKKGHGDSREMLLSRKRFLEGGHYAPLASAIESEIKKLSPKALLDIGCGEGYYTQRIKKACPECEVYGFDISKDGARIAAKRDKGLNIAVAGAYDMPYESGAFDICLNIFSPLAKDEISRVLKPGGRFIYAVSQKDHLIELKSAVYDEVFIKEEGEDGLQGFVLEEKIPVRFMITLEDREDITALFDMTPYSKKTSPEGKKRLEELERLDVTAAFYLFVYRKE